MYEREDGSLALHMGTHVHADAVLHANTVIALLPLHAADGSWVVAHFVLRQPVPPAGTDTQHARAALTRAPGSVTPWFVLVPCPCDHRGSVWDCPNPECKHKEYTPGDEQQLPSGVAEALLQASWQSLLEGRTESVQQSGMARGQAACLLVRERRDMGTAPGHAPPPKKSAGDVSRSVRQDAAPGYAVQPLVDLPVRLQQLVTAARGAWERWNRKSGAMAALEAAVSTKPFLTRDRSLTARAARAVAADLWPVDDCGEVPVISPPTVTGEKRKGPASVLWEPMV